MTERISNMELFDCIIIGAGIAGMTSAIYLKRSNLNVLLLEKSAPGGQINRTSVVENYPGFQSIEGPMLSLQIYDQIRKLNIDYRYGTVSKIELKDENKIVHTDMGSYKAKNVIIASGRTPKELGLEHEKQLTGRGVSWCAICDGPLYKNEEVAIVGGGNSALEEALYLSSICKKVYIINRSEKLKGDEILQNKVKIKENIEILYNHKVIKLNEKLNKLKSIIVTDDKEEKELQIKGLFIYIGFVPDTSILNDLNIEKDNDYLVVDEKMKTSIDGIYACGDVIKKDVYQIATAIGEAATAAISVKKNS